jgi:hypothetical protein
LAAKQNPANEAGEESAGAGLSTLMAPLESGPVFRFLLGAEQQIGQVAGAFAARPGLADPCVNGFVKAARAPANAHRGLAKKATLSAGRLRASGAGMLTPVSSRLGR